MKIIALVSVAAASRQARNAQSLFNETVADHTDSIGQRFSYLETGGLRSIFGIYMAMQGAKDYSKVDSMLSYGCWCQIRNQETEGMVAGHGAPVDALDEACKAWHQCRACTTVDFSTDDEPCDPDNAYYEIDMLDSTRITCKHAPNECAVSAIGDKYH